MENAERPVSFVFYLGGVPGQLTFGLENFIGLSFIFRLVFSICLDVNGTKLVIT